MRWACRSSPLATPLTVRSNPGAHQTMKDVSHGRPRDGIIWFLLQVRLTSDMSEEVPREGCQPERQQIREMSGYLLRPATRLIVTAMITAPNTYESNMCRRTARRMSLSLMSVSEI